MTEALSSQGAPHIHEVASFRSAALHGDPLLYPGERPEGNYVTDGEFVTEVQATNRDGRLVFTTFDENGAELGMDDYLQMHGAAPMEARIPVLGFGANVCPGSLLAKYRKAARSDMLVIPVVYADMPGYDVVWSAGPGMNGNFIAALYRGPETTMTAAQVGVNFLTREQLLVLHATELSYDLQKVELTIDDTKLPAYYYAGKDSVLLADGKPVAIENVPATGRQLRAATTATLLQELLDNSDIMTELRTVQPGLSEDVTDPRAYVDYVKSLRKKPGDESPRGDLKRRLHAIIAERGMARVSESGRGKTVGWANPSTLSTYGEQLAGTNQGNLYVLPSSELPLDNWPDPAARQKVLHAIGEHFHRHFPKNTQ